MKNILFFIFLLSSLFVNGKDLNPDFGITELSINGIYGAIYDENCYFTLSNSGEEVCTARIVVFMPYYTDLSRLQPIIKTTEGSTVVPTSGEIISFESYDKTVNYTVTDKNGNVRKYEIYIILPKKDEPRILSYTFSILGKTITPRVRDFVDDFYIRVPDGTDISNLIPNIILTENSTISPDLDTAQDFNKDVTYTIRNERGDEHQTTVYVSNLDVRIDSITTDTLIAGDIVTLYGHFAPKNNDVILGHEGRFYDVWARSIPKVDLISENDSVIQVKIPEKVYEDKHFLKVWYKESSDAKDVMILNPKRPIILSIDRSSIKLGEDNIKIKGENLKSIYKAYFVNFENGDVIVFDAISNIEGSELILNNTPIQNHGVFLLPDEPIKTAKYNLILDNEYSTSLDDIEVEITVNENTLKVLNDTWDEQQKRLYRRVF